MAEAFHLDAAGTYVLNTAGGVSLHTVTVGKAGTGTSTVTLHDSVDASGAVVAVIGTDAVSSLVYDVTLSKGLTAVVAGTTAPDVTITIE